MGVPQIDLHDLTVSEAIEKFVRVYNSLVADGYRGRIEIIHGYGSSGAGGVIRQKLRQFLSANSDRFKQITAGDNLGNPGVTYVHAKGRLSSASAAAAQAGPLRTAILNFCATPKAEAKILTKLCSRFGDRAVHEEVRAMVREGVLEPVKGKREIEYRSV